jgi:hypothetical protein
MNIYLIASGMPGKDFMKREIILISKRDVIIKISKRDVIISIVVGIIGAALFILFVTSAPNLFLN